MIKMTAFPGLIAAKKKESPGVLQLLILIIGWTVLEIADCWINKIIGKKNF